MRIWLVIYTAWLTLGLGPAFAAPHSSVGIRHWDVEDGLPQSSVTAITQTRDGYLWVGTVFNGLARFDGIRFTRFNEANTPGLTSGRIVRLYEDSQTNLWIGTETAGVFLVRDDKVTSLDIGRGAREGRLISICEDAVGAVWLYTADGQLCRYHSNRVDVWNAGSGRPSATRAVIAEKSGLTWVGTDWTLTALGPVPPGPASALPVVQEVQYPVLNKLDYLLASAAGGYWRLANSRIEKWSGNQLERDLGAYPWTNTIPVVTACEDALGNLVVGTYGDGLYYFDNQGGWRRFGVTELHHAFVLSVTLDREGCLWVGTDGGGLARIKHQQFEVVESSLNATVQSVAPDREGGVWIGYNWDRVEHWAGGQTRGYTNLLGGTDSVPDRPRLFVRSVLVDSRGDLWVGSYLGGLLERRGDQFVPNALSAMLPRDSDFSALYEDPEQRLWVGTQSGYAVRDPNGWRIGTNRFASSVIRAFCEDGAGGVWVGTQGGGVNRLHEDRVETLTRQHGLPSDNITALYRATNGVLWIGTASGLARYQNGRCVSLAGQLGSASDGISYLVADKAGFLWIGTAVGLMRAALADLDRLALGQASRIQPRVFSKADGLPSLECSQGAQPGACRAADGRLWFSTTKGLVTIDPDRLRPNTNPPPVIIESVLIDGQSRGTPMMRSVAPRSVTLSPGQQVLEIHYTCLNLAAPEKARFRYRLKDHETDWTEWQGRFARYSRLPPDEYLFEVTACNEDGIWNPTPSTVGVVVLPPFWRTWWFMASSVSLLVGLIIALVHYVSTQRLQRQLAALKQQEAIERERSRIARDLHDQLGANLTQVALLSELTEADKDLPAEVESHARQIGHTAIETTRSLDEIVWTVNPSNDTLESLVNYLCKYAQDFFALAGLRYRLEVPPEVPNRPITPETRHNVFLAAREAINNVVKHSGAAAAWLRLKIEPDRFIIEVEDNGQGMQPGDENKGRNGLKNMRRRLQEIGGEFQALPGGEGGTLVLLIAPIPQTQKGRSN